MSDGREVSYDEAMYLWSYNPDTGIITWNNNSDPKRNGMVAGYLARGYRRIRYEGVTYYGHRLAWFLYYGEQSKLIIDHINGNPSDNRIANLRQATLAQNSMNAKAPTRNTSGFRGVSFDKRDRKWRVQISANGNRIRKRGFDTIEEASAFYDEKAKLLHGEFSFKQRSEMKSHEGGLR